jgi:hypothetical protein
VFSGGIGNAATVDVQCGKMVLLQSDRGNGTALNEVF